MFKLPGNAFQSIRCPELDSTGSCYVVNCLFSHDLKKRELVSDPPNQKRQKAEPSLTEITPTSEKETKAISPVTPPAQTDLKFVLPKELPSEVSIPRKERLIQIKSIAQFLKTQSDDPTPNRLAIEKEFKLASTSSGIQDYLMAVLRFLGRLDTGIVRNDPRFIVPLEVNPSPALVPVRKKFIQQLVEAIKSKQPDNKTPVLTALEMEFKVASTNTSSTYNLAIKREIYNVTRADKARLQKKPTHSKEDYLRELRDLCIPTTKLAKFGYIMEPPATIDEPEPLRHCHRCKNELKLHDAAKRTDCRYHSGKIIKTTLGQRIYLCCGGALGETDTEPCTKGDLHVFYWTSPEEMHHFLPFLRTSDVWGTRTGSLEAIGIDCEMGFTTKGFELLRVSAIDFFTGEEVLDILVKPKGEVLDLNTRWSGVAEIKDEAIAFEDMVTLLGEIVDQNTVLIGHGLENDMNAMRLIHNKVVDTAILYPKHKATPTFRFSLKQLAFQYLGRTIQTGEHDSGEDSLAAIDVTKYFIERDLERKKGHRVTT